MTWDVQGPLSYLTGLIEGLTTLQSGTVYQGEPTSPDSLVSAAVSIGGFELNHETTGTMIRWQRYWSEFYYRVGGDQEAAEGVLADVVDQFIQAWQSDLTLGGTALDTRLEGGYGDSPDYRNLRGPEFRCLPIVVAAKQRNVRPH